MLRAAFIAVVAVLSLVGLAAVAGFSVPLMVGVGIFLILALPFAAGWAH